MNLDERTAEIRTLLDEFADAHDCTIQNKWQLAAFLAKRLKADSGRGFTEVTEPVESPSAGSRSQG